MHLRGAGNAIETTHGLPYRIVSPPDFRLAGPVHRTDVFNEHPFEVSLAALIGHDEAVMVHAERVADASGASEYGNLPEAAWPSSEFRRRGMCVTLAPDDVEGEHDLEWLRDNGFDPTGALALEQSLLASSDHNEEIVLSLAVKVTDCSDEATVAATLEQLRDRVQISARN